MISIEFSEYEYNKIRQYQEIVCADTVQEAIMDAVSVKSTDDILDLVCRIDDRKRRKNHDIQTGVF